MEELLNSRRIVAAQVRSLRSSRSWTQAELARSLDLSQSRLSEIERGDGSFTAEQFLAILRLFNVTPASFVPGSTDADASLQNALARMGAKHLRESTSVPPAPNLASPSDAIRQALVGGSARFVAALAPVLIENVDRLSLHRIQLGLADAGFERRLPWLVENILAAVGVEEPARASTRRATLLFETFLGSVSSLAAAKGRPPDVLDPTIRSRETLAEVTAAASAPSKRWNVVTRLRPEDFALALRAARAGD